MRYVSLVFRNLVLATFVALLAACSSGSKQIDSLLAGVVGVAPVLTAIPNQIVAQESLLRVDVNNIQAGSPGDDSGMSYTCVYDTTIDGTVADTAQPCTSIPLSTVTFDTSLGILQMTPHVPLLGNYEVKITGKNGNGSASAIFTIGVRLKFAGISSLTQITGTGVTVNWVPNTSAVSYQIFDFNNSTGQYQLLQTVNGGGTAGYALTGLTPNTGYTLRVEAMDTLGNLDGNVSTKSFTTTSLTKFSMSPVSVTLASGTPQTIVVQAYDANGNPETVGGLDITPQILSGTSLGSFSAVTDNGNGTYQFVFTPTVVGSALAIGVSTNMSFFLINSTAVTVIPGPASSANSSISISGNPVVSGNSVTITATVKDGNNNPISSGATIGFTAVGGTSTGVISAITNVGNGVYTATYTGVTAGTPQNIEITANGVPLAPTAAIQVIPGEPVSANSTIAVSSGTVSSGSSVTVTATLKDINNNPVPSGITVTFNKSGGSSTGTFATVTNAGAGVYTTTYTGQLAGTAQTLTVTVDGVTLTPSTTVTVVPGAVSLANSSLSLSSATVASGSLVTGTATLRDGANNPISSGITVTFSATGGTSTGTLSAVSNAGGGVYTVHYTGVTAGTSQNFDVLINGTDLGISLPIQVLPGAPDATKSTISVSSGTVVSNSSVTITANIKDLNSNPISTGVTISFSATGGTSTGTISAVTNAGGGVYTATYTGNVAGTAQTLNVLTNGSLLGPTTSITVLPGPYSMSNSTLSTSNGTVVSGTSVTITAKLLDVNNNPISSSSTVAFTKTGGTSTGTFGSVVNQGGGVYTVTYTGVVAGTAQNIGVTINGVDSGMSTTEIVVPNLPNSTTSTIAVSSGTVVSGSNVTVTATVLDLNNNPISSGITVGVTATGGSSTGTISSVTNVGNGVYTVTYTGVTAGTAQTLNITIGGANLGPTTTVTVTPGSLYSTNSSLATTGATVSSGTSVTITATLRDLNNNPVSGTIAFTKTGGTSTGTFGSVVNQGGGVYTTTYSGVLAGTAQTIGVTINGTDSGMSLAETVVPAAPSTSNSTITVSAGTIVSGNSATITATIKDLNNNTISSGITVGIFATGGSSTGTISSITNVGNGVYTATYTGVTSGSAQTLNISINGTALGPTTTIMVNPGPLYLPNSSLTTTNTTVTSGTAVTITATLHDVNNNPVAGAIAFTKTGGTSTGTFGTTVNQGNGVYTVTYSGVAAGSAQTLGVTIAGVDSGMNVAETVVPAAPSSSLSTLSVSSNTVVSGNSVTVTATIVDLNSNPISSGITVGITATGGSSTGTMGAVANAGSGVYTATYTGVTAGSAQTLNITVGGSNLGPTNTITVNAGALNLTNSSLTTSSTTLTSGGVVTLTATLVDANNNPVPGTVAFTKTGGTSTGNFGTIVNQGGGVYTVTYTGIVAGTAQTIGVTINGTSTGLTTTETVSPGAPDPTKSTIVAATPTVASGSIDTVTATILDSNSNPISSGITVTFSKTGGSSTGTFSAVTAMGAGQYAINYQGVVAGTAQTIGVLVNGSALGPTTTITVLPGSPSSTLSTLTVGAPTVVSGNTDTITATIVDSQGNPISTGLLVTFSATGGGSTGSMSAVTNQGNGVYTATYTGIIAGSAQTLQANVNGSAFGPTQTIQVLVGQPVAANSSLSIVTSPVASGSTATISALIRDTNNNPITTEYTITFDAINGTSSGTIGSVTNSGGGNFSAIYTGQTAGTAQTVRVLADSSPISGLTGSIQVVPGAMSPGNSTFTIGEATVQSGTSTALTMNLRDANNNAISSGLTITFNKTSGGSNGTISAVTNNGNGNYTASYTGVTQGAAQTITLVLNGTTTALSVSTTVTAGPPTQISIAGPANPLNSIDCNGPYTVTLLDNNSNTTVSSGAVTLALSSSPVSAMTGTLFSDACVTSVSTSMTIPAYASTVQFWYQSYAPQSMTLTFTPSPNSIAPNSTTLTNLSVLSWIGSAVSASMSGSGPTTVADDTTGGLDTPTDNVINGGYLYVVDSAAFRILKYNLSTSQLVGWIGHVGLTEGMAAYDGSGSCTGLAIGALTPIWCTGGRSNRTNAAVINAPRYITADGTYLYVTTGGNERILRFNESDGSYQGWIGRINSTAGMTPPACVSAGSGAATPQWCFGGTAQAGTLDGMLNNPQGIVAYGGYLYVADYGNQRIQSFVASSGQAAGWVGNVNVAPSSSGQLATCSPLPTTGNPTPGWCLSAGTGTAKAANRQNLATSPSEVLAPNEGLYNPIAVTTDGTYLYVGDSGNVRVLRISLASGAFSGWLGNVATRTLAGNQPSPAAGTGKYTSNWTTGGQSYPVATPYGFGTIRGMTTDGTSYIYVSDDYHMVYRLNLADGQGVVWLGRTTTSPTGGYSGCSSTPVGGVTPGWCLGGAGNKAGDTNTAFYNPYGLTLDSSSNLYVADANNFRVQYFNTSGVFQGWIGAAASTATTWSRTIAGGLTAARWGIDDYSDGEVTGNWNGIALTGSYLLQADFAAARIKKFNVVKGSVVGYVGQIGTFPPTGPADCVGYTSGMTPDWCTGGGRTGASGGIQGYSNPFGVAGDNTYAYVADYSNARVDRIRLSDSLYMGWVGDVNATPTDGSNPNCLTTTAGSPTPGWCIGGTAQAGSINGMFNGPRSIYYDSLSGFLFVADNTGRLMELNTADGSFAGIAGSVATGATGCTITSSIAAGWCTAGTGNGATNSYGGLNNGDAIAANTSYIFVVDGANHRLDRFNKSTGAPAGFIAYMSNGTNLNTTGTGGACNGLAGYPVATPGWCYGTAVGSAINTAAGTGDNEFNSPRGVWADDNYVYVADTNNNRIVRINATTGAPAGWKGLIASTTGMTDPTCIAAGAGAITPTWCTGGTSVGGKLLGEFDFPTGITGDANYIYVMDSHNNRTVTVPR